jgi:hypothetical protein
MKLLGRDNPRYRASINILTVLQLRVVAEQQNQGYDEINENLDKQDFYKDDHPSRRVRSEGRRLLIRIGKRKNNRRNEDNKDSYVKPPDRGSYRLRIDTGEC